MRNKRKVLGTILIIAGLCCLLAGTGFLIMRVLDDREMQNQLEALRPVEGETLEPGEDVPNSNAGTQEGDFAETVGETDTDSQSGSGTESSDTENTNNPEGSGAENSGGAESGDGAENSGGSENGNGTENSGGSESTGPGSGIEIDPPETDPTVFAPSNPDRSGTVTNPYADAFRQNSDMVAWLKIDGTVIDYPVMQTMDDENYYLNRGFDKKSNSNGCLIMDTDSTVTGDMSTNLIIHGHNMKSGAMFGNLEEYEKEKYCQEHKYISLYTKECQRNYEVIAVFRSQVFKKTDNVFKYYQFFQADTQEEFDNWYTNIMALAQYDTGVTAEFGDRFLTLSTCVYHVENGRLVVVAKEIEPGDSYAPIE